MWVGLVVPEKRLYTRQQCGVGKQDEGWNQRLSGLWSFWSKIVKREEEGAGPKPGEGASFKVGMFMHETTSDVTARRWNPLSLVV
jgi:hypothetical protein